MTGKTKLVVKGYEIDLLGLSTVEHTGPSGPQFVCLEFTSGKERAWRCGSHESARKLYAEINDARKASK